jgi:hypothetical protein
MRGLNWRLMKAQISPFNPGREKTNVAVQRPTVNLKEAENLGEQAEAAARTTQPGVRFGKHGTFFGPSPVHPVEALWD